MENTSRPPVQTADGRGLHWRANVGGNVILTFQPCVYLWVQRARIASSINECQLNRWSYKELTAHSAHHICFSYRKAMASLSLISLLLVTMMVSAASAQGKSNMNISKHENLHLFGFFLLYVMMMMIIGSCVSIWRWNLRLLSQNLKHSNSSRTAEELLHSTSTIMSFACSGVSHKTIKTYSIGQSLSSSVQMIIYQNIIFSLEIHQRVIDCFFVVVLFNRFTTMRNKRICADPTKLWTNTSMAFLDGKKWQQMHSSQQQNHQNQHWHPFHLHTILPHDWKSDSLNALKWCAIKTPLFFFCVI